jgi:hypothetical protein
MREKPSNQRWKVRTEKSKRQHDKEKGKGNK